MFTAALFTIAKTRKQPTRPSTGGWINKMWHIYTYNGVLLSQKKNKMSSAATRTDIDIIILNEVNQKEKGKYHGIIYMWNLKKNDAN